MTSPIVNSISCPACQCGCGKPSGFYTHTHNKRGIRKGDPRPFIQGHWDLADRLESRIIIIDGIDYRTVSLGFNFESIVDISDYHLISKQRWCHRFNNGNRNKPGYAIRNVIAGDHTVGFQRQMHRVIMGIYDPKIMVDHSNGNTLDNRRINLRIASRAQNGGNRKLNSNNQSGLKGVYQKGKKWCASIRENGKLTFLGNHDTPLAAHEAYCAAAKRIFGEFWRAS